MEEKYEVDDYATGINYNLEVISCLINDFMSDFETHAEAGRDCRKYSCSIRLLMIQILLIN